MREPRTEQVECAIENLLKEVGQEFKNNTFTLPGGHPIKSYQIDVSELKNFRAQER